MTDEDRRAATPVGGDAAGIDEAAIVRVVEGFYADVRADGLLGPVFASRLADAEWPGHLARIVRFWAAIILGDGGYRGRPMQAHAALPIDARHFDRWLALFRASAEVHLAPPAAALLVGHAERIAASLEAGIGLAQRRGLGRDRAFRLPEMPP